MQIVIIAILYYCISLPIALNAHLQNIFFLLKARQHEQSNQKIPFFSEIDIEQNNDLWLDFQYSTIELTVIH